MLSPLQRVSPTLIPAQDLKREIAMNTLLLKLNSKFQDLLSGEEGQDLVEYALICALLAFGIVSGMSSVAKGIDTAFSNISSTLGTYST